MDLKLPPDRIGGHRRRHLSMDEYLEFVLFNLRHTVDRESARKAKIRSFVGVPFTMHDDGTQ